MASALPPRFGAARTPLRLDVPPHPGFSKVTADPRCRAAPRDNQREPRFFRSHQPGNFRPFTDSWTAKLRAFIGTHRA
jgi:hypothetical protein